MYDILSFLVNVYRILKYDYLNHQKYESLNTNFETCHTIFPYDLFEYIAFPIPIRNFFTIASLYTWKYFIVIRKLKVCGYTSTN